MIAADKIKSKNAVATTAFPQPNDFSDDYFESLDSQDFKDFDIIIVNDGCKNLDYFISKYKGLNIIELEPADGIAKNREKLINTTKKFYEKIVFCDFDDFFSSNRVRETLKYLDSHDIVCNDLNIYFDGSVVSESFFSNDLSHNSIIKQQDIVQYNYFGLSNTGIRSDSFSWVDFAPQLEVVDWYFFSLVMLNGANAIFINSSKTFYRQHNRNIANIKSFSIEQLKNEIFCKKILYELLAKKDDFYSCLYMKIIDFEKKAINVSSIGELKKLSAGRISNNAWWSLINLQC
jgi:hypothetical protein